MQKPIKPMNRFIPDNIYVNEVEPNSDDMCFCQTQEQADEYVEHYIRILKLEYGAMEFKTLYTKE